MLVCVAMPPIPPGGGAGAVGRAAHGRSAVSSASPSLPAHRSGRERPFTVRERTISDRSTLGVASRAARGDVEAHPAARSGAGDDRHAGLPQPLDVPLDRPRGHAQVACQRGDRPPPPSRWERLDESLLALDPAQRQVGVAGRRAQLVTVHRHHPKTPTQAGRGLSLACHI